jgi:hypothetical protein
MKKIIILIFAVLAFSWTPVVSAEQSPESIVSCSANATPYLVLGESIPETINAEQCKTYPDGGPDACSPCINSLENQGCKIVDVVVATISPPFTVVTYLLSCVRP